MNSLFKSLLATTIILGGAFTAFAQTEIRVDSPLPMKESFEKILPGFEAKTGHKVNVRYGTGVGTKQEAAKGDPYDVFINLPPFQEAMNSGNVMKDSATTLGSFVLALTVKKGAPSGRTHSLRPSHPRLGLSPCPVRIARRPPSGSGRVTLN